MPLQDEVVTRSTVERMLAEHIDCARDRERNLYERLTTPLSDKIVLFGAGGLGKKCLAGLRHYGIEPLAFADNNSKLWGKEVEGVPVFGPGDAAARFGSKAVFVVSIWGAFASRRMSDHVSRLHSLGCVKVVPFGPLLWRYPAGALPHYAADLPSRVLEEANDALRCFDLWADDESRREYAAQLKWRLSFDFSSMAPPSREDVYFPPDLTKLSSDETFVDCGAYDGDTLGLFLRRSQSTFKRAVCFEPDPANFERLSAKVSMLPPTLQERIELKRAAVGANDATVRFAAQGTSASFIGAGDLEVDCVTLDRHLRVGNSDFVKPTIIKMDIEGAEPDAIHGAASTIREHSPVLAISCYHRQDHLWSIPLLIHSLNPEYRFYLRPHDLEGWDLVCYAMPPVKLPPGGSL